MEEGVGVRGSEEGRLLGDSGVPCDEDAGGVKSKFREMYGRICEGM